MSVTPEYKAAWYRQNRERVREQQRLYYQAHKDEIAAKRAADPDAARARARASYQRTRTRKIAAVTAWRAANREKIKERVRGHHATYRARRDGAPVVESINRQAIIDRDASTCYLCGTVLHSDQIHLDHVIPLARGGNHTAANLRVACAPCNLSKGARLVG